MNCILKKDKDLNIKFIGNETHEMTSQPYPANNRKRRGPKSRAGLIGLPTF